MFTRAFLIVVLLVALPLWSQIGGNERSADSTSRVSDDDRMVTPSPVNIQGYAVALGSETHSNYLSGGLTFNSAYSDNLLGGSGVSPISDVGYSIWPMVTLEKTTSRLQSMFTYSPGFTFYQRTSALNQADQNFGADLQYRVSPHVNISLVDSFQRTSNVFNQFSSASVAVSGSTQAPTTPLIAPIADQIRDISSAEITYQFGANGMVGGSGTFNNLHYPTPSQVPGLYDSTSSGGSAFYTRRVFKKHYLGASYQYQKILAYPTAGWSETQTHAVLLFYTLYLSPTFSISLSGGPEYCESAQPSLPTIQGWSPTGSASLGWQRKRTTFAVSYSRMVSGGVGLVGTYHLSSANGSFRRQLTRRWSVDVSGTYSLYENVEPFLPLSNVYSDPGGHTVLGTAAVQHQISEHLNVGAGYAKGHQSYSRLAVAPVAPNHVWISISYRFMRPLGR